MCLPAAAAAAFIQAGSQVAQGVAGYGTNLVNAKIAKQEGKLAANAAYDDANRINDEGQRYLGSQRVAQAKSGVDLAQGSPADIAAESAKNIELDRLNAIYAGQLKRTAKDYEATQYKRQAVSGLLGAAFGSGASILAGGKEAGWFK